MVARLRQVKFFVALKKSQYKFFSQKELFKLTNSLKLKKIFIKKLVCEE